MSLLSFPFPRAVACVVFGARAKSSQIFYIVNYDYAQAGSARDQIPDLSRIVGERFFCISTIPSCILVAVEFFEVPDGGFLGEVEERGGYRVVGVNDLHAHQHLLFGGDACGVGHESRSVFGC
jgi:hypothetical protein